MRVINEIVRLIIMICYHGGALGVMVIVIVGK